MFIALIGLGRADDLCYHVIIHAKTDGQLGLGVTK